MKIEPNKFYRTRDGRKARIYAVDGEGKYPIHGAIWDFERWHVVTWNSAGNHVYSTESGLDIIAEWKDEPLSVTFDCVWARFGGLTHPIGSDACKQLEPLLGKKTTVTVVEKQGE